jgi:asparagine synthase (glutamine-hydrolysing)
MSVHLVRGDTQSPLILSRKDSEEAQRPFLNPCNSAWITATHYKAADCHAAVMLEGLLGNFTVSWDGFERFGELLRSFRWVTLSRQIVAFHKAGGGSLRGILQWAFALAFPAFMRTNPFQSRFLRPDSPWARRVLSSLRTRRTWKKPAETRLDWIEFVDPGLLQHVPRLQLGLDLRDPLAARPLVELCLRLPSRYFFDQGRTRRIARELLRDVVPESIAKEPRRGQQGGDWRAGAEPAIPAMLSLVERAADDDRLSRMFDLSRLAATLRSWPKDGWDDAGQVQIYRHDLIRAVCAIQWVFDVDKWAATAATGPEP